ncbi:FAD-NAD(P)-binding [Flavobacteriaceae bacterium MAR_2010_188]|nr:FAD-NAD(P)-binding [Flavobacteriaceae bacterium MAR_2010_188]
MKNKNIAIIGSGATAIYLLKHIAEHYKSLKKEISSVTVYERDTNSGMGMPYNPNTTDIYNLANISSEEIPELLMSFGDWLREQNKPTLKKLNVTEFPIDDSEVYSRLALGEYLRDQYLKIGELLEARGIEFLEKLDTEVSDIEYKKDTNLVNILTKDQKEETYSKVIIATGHRWSETDNPKKGYYGSPWPIQKILPKKGEYYNFPIGTLGASLSAFDVVTSLAHRHGEFIKTDSKYTFNLNPKAKGFKILMHSSEGWLPHLQYEQRLPMREIYRHTDREQMLSLIDDNGYLRLETFFHSVCRNALIEAFEKDKLERMAIRLKDANFGIKEFVEMMVKDHEYSDSFEGMRKEMVAATNSIERSKPIHWKETLDDLMYCLNFHAELLPAEDHHFFRKEVMSFLMNVIAALPLSSAKILLALYDAECIDMIPGRVNVLEDVSDNTKTGVAIEVENEKGKKQTIQYKMYINCAGQKSIQIQDYPFKTLVENGTVRKACAAFEDEEDCKDLIRIIDEELLFEKNENLYLYTGGIEVDAAYRVIDEDDIPNENIMDVTFTHTSGPRPYSYGLQACNATSKILVEAWVLSLKQHQEFDADIENATQLYEENDL